MKKQALFFVRLVILLVVAGFIGWKIWEWWDQIAAAHLTVRWELLPGAMAVFAGVVLSSALVWRWLAWRMGDRSPTAALVGAYVFSQMGKYVPGKVVLLLMRIERSGRAGMSAGVCTLSTLLENALYMVSGGLAGVLALMAHHHELMESGKAWAKWVLPGSIGVIVILVAACHPAIFYGAVNWALRKGKKEIVPKEKQLGMGTLVLAVIMFLPCWMFGGLALWASARCLTDTLPIASSLGLMGAFALSVIVGMLSMLPGGLGIREAIAQQFLQWQLQPILGIGNAVAVSVVAVVLLRLAQILAETILGVVGAALTSARKPAEAAVDLTRR